ncbi:MAG TPA: PDZ domain-containing protein, partial [Gemmatimonadaceae bacterium]
GDDRDTLGLRITDVTADSPAAKAGIQEGDRLQAINGIDLRLAPIDVGDPEMADAIARRLTRELGKLNPGDQVSLKLYHDGQTRTVSLKTVDSGDLYGAPGQFMKRADNRAMLGVSLSVTGNKRDTLGVLIIGVNDDGPAAKAGLEEGNRIAEINGVNLKVDHADAGDSYVASARYERLQKEMTKVKPGDDVTLQVYADGRFKTVHLKATKASDIAGANTFIFNSDGGPMPAMNLNIDGQQVREEVQRAMDQARQSLQRVRIEPGVRWMNDNDTPAVIRMEQVEPAMAPGQPTPPMPPTPATAPRAVVWGRTIRATAAPMAIEPRTALRVIRF